MASTSDLTAYRSILAGICLLVLPSVLWGQAENVPVSNPVYLFLDRMESRGLLTGYFDAILPLSRRVVAGHLSTIANAETSLTAVEREFLADYLSEFSYDMNGSLNRSRGMINPPDSAGFSLSESLLGPMEKYLFAGGDSTISLFANGLLTVDSRWIAGDALGHESAQYVQFGGRFRGTAFGALGYYLEGTNAQFWGSRELLLRDDMLSQAHTLRVTDTQNFDFAEGYVRYSGSIFSAQLGRERLLWGLGYDQQMVASGNVRVYDFIRAEARYKSFRYTFLHAWLLGEQSSVNFTIPGDTTVYTEPTNADKYFAAHRFEFSFPRLFDIGFQEMVIYSNRSPDLAYLNPLIVIESAQRSRGERDNVYWAFDLETHFLPGLQLSGTILFDDLHLGEFFEPRWYNRYAYQAGVALSDPLFLPNMLCVVEYTRVEPFVFSHNRSRESTYSSLDALLGPRIGPNADAWFFRLDWNPVNRVTLSGRVSLERSGENIYDSTGVLVKNVGGDYRQPHRPDDPNDRVFLDGNLMKASTIDARLTWEFVHQMWFEAWYLDELIRDVTSGFEDRNHTWGLRIRTEF
jgi:hypothetical protein